MSTTHSTASASTASISSNNSAAPTTVIDGQTSGVAVQSQLATSTVAGSGATSSNLSQVVGDLGAAHTAHSGWLASETAKVSQWGEGEIARLMTQTKSAEARLVAEAQAKQAAMEDAHKVELSKLVQELDARKAVALKGLEDDLQRQIQATLTTTKTDINNIETQMNERKMALMTQAQQQTASDVDRLSTLSVAAKLVPSVTRTVIETNTETGTVIAIAAGGEISTGAAAAQTQSTGAITAVPVAGKLTQESDVTTGTMNRNDNNRVVGTGAIVNTLTEVSTGAHTATAPIQGSGRPVEATRTEASHPVESAHTEKKHIDASWNGPVFHDDVSATKNDATYNKNTSVATEPKEKEGLLSKMKHAITGEPKSTDAHKARV